MGTVFIREKKDRDFTMLNNTFLRDNTLSSKAKGVFAYLLFLPDDWEIYQTELVKHFSDGITSIRSALLELEEKGYLSKTRLKDEKGLFCGIEYKIIEDPKKSDIKANSNAENSSDNPLLENLNLDSLNSDNRTLPNTNNTKDLIIPNKTPAAPVTKTKKVNPKAELFDEISVFTKNETLQKLLKGFLSNLLKNVRGYSLEQWRIQLKNLNQYSGGNDQKAIEKVSRSFSAGYRQLVFDNELKNNGYTKGSGSVMSQIEAGWQPSQADIDLIKG